MTFGDVLTNFFAAALLCAYIPAVIYSYGKLNYYLNKGVEDDMLWRKNRNIAVITAVTLAIPLAVYIYLEMDNDIDASQKPYYKLFIKSEDPLFKQIVDDVPINCIWTEYDGITERLKRSHLLL